MILHIPHSSKVIPDNLREQIVLSDEALSTELRLMTDAFTEELFALPESTIIKFPISRLIVDVERFPDDEEEPMSKVGMGVIYTHTAFGGNLRRSLQTHEKQRLLSLYYEPHHQMLLTEVTKELAMYGNALIIDCHSFPSQPLPCDMDQSTPRPDFCIGTDSFHTPKALIQKTTMELQNMGYSVGINRPYEGTLVPMKFFKKDKRIVSILIEISRHLYMDEISGEKTIFFNSMKEHIHKLLYAIMESQRYL